MRRLQGSEKIYERAMGVLNVRKFLANVEMWKWLQFEIACAG